MQCLSYLILFIAASQNVVLFFFFFHFASISSSSRTRNDTNSDRQSIGFLIDYFPTKLTLFNIYIYIQPLGWWWHNIKCGDPENKNIGCFARNVGKIRTTTTTKSTQNRRASARDLYCDDDDARIAHIVPNTICSMRGYGIWVFFSNFGYKGLHSLFEACWVNINHRTEFAEFNLSSTKTG